MGSALITGVTGQDGAYLSKFLLNKSYTVFGTYRKGSSPDFWRLEDLGIKDKVNLIETDLTSKESLKNAIKISNPDEIYNLAAQSHIGKSFNDPINTTQINAIGPLIFLEIIKELNLPTKFYQASTSELYGTARKFGQSQDENHPFMPSSPYAISKLHAFHSVKIYREVHKIFACNGILFNHESPLRSLEFLTRKVTNAVARIKLNLQKELTLGNIDTKRDWGFAPDYVKAMWLMLQKDEPKDYVIATGETHSVKDFVEEVFKVAGDFNWQDYVKLSDTLKRPSDDPYSLGNFTKAKNELGWQPTIKFKELAKKMYDADLSRWKRHLDGEIFPWDNKSLNVDISFKQTA